MEEAKEVEKWGILVGADVDLAEVELVEDEEEEVEMPILILWHVTGAGCMAIWLHDCPSTGNPLQTLGSSNTSSSRGTSFKSGQKGPKRRGRGRQVRFGALNMLYDEDGNSCPVDDVDQL